MKRKESSLFTQNLVEGIRQNFFPGAERITRKRLKAFLNKAGKYHIRKEVYDSAENSSLDIQTTYRIYHTESGAMAGEGLTPWEALTDLIENRKPHRYYLLAGLYERGMLND